MIVDQKYNPNLQSGIFANTLLARGVPLSKFIVGSSSGLETFNDLSQSSRIAIARNLYPQAEFIESINGRFNKFTNHRLNVIEGVYFPGEGESLGGINVEKNEGRSVVYQLIDQEGNVDVDLTYDLAVYWKDFFNYDTITLAYDTFNADGSLNANIIVTMPEIPSSYSVKFNKNIKTIYNSNESFNDELVEITL
jgi:hypothetical protein